MIADISYIFISCVLYHEAVGAAISCLTWHETVVRLTRQLTEWYDSITTLQYRPSLI